MRLYRKEKYKKISNTKNFADKKAEEKRKEEKYKSLNSI